MASKINAKDYVVLDVETNGLSSLRDDLLSISIFKPDDKKTYDRFLPLELSNYVYTTEINGITPEMLRDKLPLTQEEFDAVIKGFELENRTILVYGNIDEKFIKNYLKRKKITGFDKLKFYNFKHDIISSRFSEGNITKDNLCRLYGIKSIQKVHSGLNDCILEWQLFKKMNGDKLIVINSEVYKFSKDYIIPVSYLTTYPNAKYCIDGFPDINCSINEVYKMRINSSDIRKFENNISGVTIEHLINSLLDARNMNKESIKTLLENKKKLKRIGGLPSIKHSIPVILNNDGTIGAVDKIDEAKVKDINKVTEIIKKEIQPLIEYIKHDIFNDNQIMSQELIINERDNVLAKCDLSSKDSILEIKTFIPDLEKIKYQLYYQANGRSIYFLQTEWNSIQNRGLVFTVYKVEIQKNIKGQKDRRINKTPTKRSIKRKIANKVCKYFQNTRYIWSTGNTGFKENENFNSKYVKEYVEKNKISVKVLANNMGVSESTTRNWLNGKSRPSVWNAFAICVWLNLDENLVITKTTDEDNDRI